MYILCMVIVSEQDNWLILKAQRVRKLSKIQAAEANTYEHVRIFSWKSSQKSGRKNPLWKEVVWSGEAINIADFPIRDPLAGWCQGIWAGQPIGSPIGMPSKGYFYLSQIFVHHSVIFSSGKMLVRATKISFVWSMVWPLLWPQLTMHRSPSGLLDLGRQFTLINIDKARHANWLEPHTPPKILHEPILRKCRFSIAKLNYPEWFWLWPRLVATSRISLVLRPIVAHVTN